MAKYDWIGLEKEYILSDYKSVSAFLKEKGITCNGNTNKQTKGWNEKRAIKGQQKSNKVVEKVIEKQSEKEAQQIVDIKSVANLLLEKTAEAVTELNKHTDMFGTVHESIIDRADIKKLTSALKDLKDVLVDKDSNSKEDKIDSYLSKLEGELHD